MIMSRGGALYNVDLFSHIVSNTARPPRVSPASLQPGILNYLDVMKLDIDILHSCRVYRVCTVKRATARLIFNGQITPREK